MGMVVRGGGLQKNGVPPGGGGGVTRGSPVNLAHHNYTIWKNCGKFRQYPWKSCLRKYYPTSTKLTLSFAPLLPTDGGNLLGSTYSAQDMLLPKHHLIFLLQLAKKPGAKGVTVSKMDCSANSKTCRQYDVTSYPTLLYFRLGQHGVTTYLTLQYFR